MEHLYLSDWIELTNQSWLELSKHAEIEILQIIGSGHGQIVLYTNSERSLTGNDI